ncbi:MAG: hypothetical protein KatS3mg001_262 [Candidatus Pacearchaeota archaeon]|nr:MAG: hypothetical protein KatS3mg001_262 [Candidatus Pacearchaeota archaeon]
MSEENQNQNSQEEKKVEEKKQEENELNEKDEEKKSKKEDKLKKKRDFAIVNSYNLPISTKHSIAICKFIKGKTIEEAILELNEVLKFKKAIPMKGEIPHRKGIMSGRFPKKATSTFIKLLKSLSSNASFHQIENPIIVKAVANIGERPWGRFGSVRRKRTHVMLIAKSKTDKE